MPTCDWPYDVIWFYDDFQLFPCTVEVTTFSCSRWPRTPKIGIYRGIYTPFSIRTFRSFTDTMVMPKKCRLSTRILRELTIFSNFPALLRWQHFHVPVNLELRKSAHTELFTPHLVSEHLEVSRIQWWCRKNADFRPEFCENWRFSAISPHCWGDNIFMFPLT